MNKADKAKLAYVGSIPGKEKRDSDSWYTPERYIHAARDALGGDIDLDPFSSKLANKVVRASNYFTVEGDAFSKSWIAETIFTKPPYRRGLINKASDKFIEQYQLNNFDRAVVLVNNATETKWFQALLKEAIAICFTDHRIGFISPDGKAVSGNTRGQVFLLFEQNTKGNHTLSRFERAFRKFGQVLLPDLTERQIMHH